MNPAVPGPWRRAAGCALIALCGVLASAPAAADAFDEIAAARQRGDHAQARQRLEAMAAAGDARARHGLALMLRAGEGGPAEPERALALLRAAAEQGHAPAQRALGHALVDGDGTPADAAEGARWLCLAAQAGDADAQNRCGLLLMLGQGVARDEAAAVAQWRAATAQGHPRAPLNLGLASLNGNGVPQDDAEAVRWFRLSAERGYATGAYYYAMMLAMGRGVAADAAASLTWLQRAAEGGETDAMLALAARLAESGAADDAARALALSGQVAVTGHAAGMLLHGGLLGPRDPVQAYAWLWLAAEAGQAMAWSVLPDLRRDLRGERLTAARAATQALRQRLLTQGAGLGPAPVRDPALVGRWTGEGQPEGHPRRRWTQQRDADGWFEIDFDYPAQDGEPARRSRATGLWWTADGVMFAAHGASPDETWAYRYTTRADGCLDKQLLDEQTLQPHEIRYRFQECPERPDAGAAPAAGRTLFEAAHAGAMGLLRQQIAAGAPLDWRNPGGWTPLMIAAAERQVDAVRALIDAGANVNAGNALGRTALMFAASYGQTEIVRLLLAAGARPSVAPTDGDGVTALMAAAQHGHLAVVDLLLAAGADPTPRTRGGERAVDLARQAGHDAVARRLEAAAGP